jgi:hypothetical protein
MKNYTTFHLYDYEEGSFIGPEFSSIVEFFRYHCERTFLDLPNCRWRAVRYFEPIVWYNYYVKMHGYYRWFTEEHPRAGTFQSRYTIKNEYGKNFIDPQNLFKLALDKGLKLFRDYSHKWWRDPDYKYWWERPILPPKNNKNKIKKRLWAASYYRTIKTTNERRQNELHQKEYGEYIVRGKRKNKALPSSWDDRVASAFDTHKSWKHNSKRKHQWKEKD